MKSKRTILTALAATASLSLTLVAAPEHPDRPRATLLVSGMASGSGSTIGPDGALYVTEGATGRVLRVDPRSGHLTTFASGLPASIVGIGGAMDVAFIGRKAYVLVTLVGPDVGGHDVVGLYRVDSRDHASVVADIGAFSLAHPPSTAFFIPTGVQYALQPYRDGFLVTDGHHNRVLHVTRDGSVSQVLALPNIVPTGLEMVGSLLFMAEAGPVPHLPENGRIVAFGPAAEGTIQVASGARLLVDVELGPRHTLYALAQGIFQPGNPEGSPANPDTGSLVRVNPNGSFSVVVSGLDRPTSLEFIRDTAYIVTLDGEIWTVDDVDRRD